MSIQRAKKVMSDSLGRVDFAIGLGNPVLNLPYGQAKIFRRKLQKRTKITNYKSTVRQMF